MLSADVAEWLLDQGLTGVFVEYLPDSPDAAIGIYTRAGRTPESREGLEYPQFQVLVRGGADPRSGNATAQTVYNLLHNLAPNGALVAGGEHVLLITAAQSPYHIGRDVKGRHEWSINFSCRVWNPERR